MILSVKIIYVFKLADHFHPMHWFYPGAPVFPTVEKHADRLNELKTLTQFISTVLLPSA